MTGKKSQFDLLKVAGLRPKKDMREKKYAGFHRRMLAATIDSFLLLFLAPLIDMAFNGFYAAPPVDLMALIAGLRDVPEAQQGAALWRALAESGAMGRWLANGAWQFGVLALLTGLCWRRWSATPGKMLVGIRVADATTEGPISTRQIIVRLLGYVVSTLPLCAGFFWIGVDKRRQGWHDKMANTVVLVRGRQAKPDSPVADPSNFPAP